MSWREVEEGSTREQQAHPACSLGSENKSAGAHSTTAGDGDAHNQWLQQLEVWAIDEMVEATEEQLCKAEAEGRSQQRAAEQRQAAQGQCPLARAGGVCVVQECEWCEEGQQGSERQRGEEEQWGREQPNEPGVVRGVAGVGTRPVSERHMPNFVSEAGDRGDDKLAASAQQP